MSLKPAIAAMLILGFALATAAAAKPPSAPASGPAHVYPGAAWEEKAPGECGMDPAALARMAEYLGGRGCVARGGYLVYAWGEQSRRTDVASACKPVIAHFVFQAIQDGRLSGLDERAAKWQPALTSINPELGYKDREIRFGHLVTQTSCYGVSERPGAAFDYNDWQMALLWDTLFLKVYAARYDTVDREVLRPLLTDALQCQDHPTFMAFGPSERPGRLAISVRDFARFGLLYLHQGRWRDRQLISPARALAAVTSPLPNSIPRTTARKAEMCPGARTLGSQKVPDDQTDHAGSYSYLWWTNGIDRHGRRRWPHAPLGTFGAFGHQNGQRAVVVIPSQDLVVSWNETSLGNKPGNPVNEALGLLMRSLPGMPTTTAPAGGTP